MRKLPFFIILIIGLLFGCSSNDNPVDPEPVPNELYFPPIHSNDWETLSVAEVGWNTNAEQPLYDFLEANDTDAFIILKDGKIVVEKYFGTFGQSSIHSWNSAAKTLTAFTVCIEQEEGFLSIDNPSSDYMGAGWSSLTLEQESRITVRNHLTMTTGLDYTVAQNFCTDPECFLYKNEPDTYWYYHQGAYTVLDNIITGAVGQDFKDYFNAKI